MLLIDNISRTLLDDLTATIKEGSRISIAASCFSIYAYRALKEALMGIDEMRFIFTSPTFIKEKPSKEQREFYIPRLHRERALTGSEFEVRLRNELTQKSIARECAEWARSKVTFLSNCTGENMPSCCLVDDSSYIPIQSFTTVELGVERGNDAYTMIVKNDAPDSLEMIKKFDEIWSDRSRLRDVTEEVIESMSAAFKENPPELLYFITIYNIFREFLDDVSEDVLPNESTGFKNTAIWNKLYRFQKDAALGIINKLEKYNGCILADSVGLGKTFTALSVIKYYELRNKSVLVLCPKKLGDNWVTYRANYRNNPLASDRLRYDVLYHTDLSRVSGVSNGLDLSKINWGNYDLVVIDESHNFRNGGQTYYYDDDEEEMTPHENRYLRLLNQVIRQGVKTKVLMLSATPVNNRFNDLKNQLQLAYEGDSDHFDSLLDTESSVDEIFRQAQIEYNQWIKLPEEERTMAALQEALSFDFFELLDSVTIARSRSHIMQYYDTSEIGTFPKRLPVISRRPRLTLDGDLISYSEIYELLSDLSLAIYVPSDFLKASKRDDYLTIDGEGSESGLTRTGREQGVRRLMCINLLKRLESSIHAFRLTIDRLIDLHQSTLDKIGRAAQGERVSVEDYADSELDLDDLNSDLLVGKGKNPIAIVDLDDLKWRRLIEEDVSKLVDLRGRIAAITPSQDAKLAQLRADIKDKVTNPINEGNRKVIIFTAFSDTAAYLYESLADDILRSYGLHTLMITGDVDARSTLKLKGRQGLSFNDALTLFSPISKDKEALMPEVKEEIDILIATDCISEGQNLQDCDYVLNYDIHWNPVRIIQRFGRVDRIGSRNAQIQLVNYWPDIELDEYIKLKGRVESRMKVSVLTATGDGNILSDKEKGDLEYRKKQLQRLQKEVVDLEEMNTGVSISDLGLNEFRLDLLEYTRDHDDLEQMPLGLHALLPSSDTMPPGVIYILKNRNQGINIDRKNRLHPFYMVYVTMEGEVRVNHLQPKEILDLLRHACRGKSAPYPELCQAFNRETKDGSRMGTYSDLLSKAVESIVTVKEQSDVQSFLQGDSPEIFIRDIKGLDDFELICFFIVR